MHDTLDIGDKTHIKHPVGLVDNQHIDSAQQQAATFEMIQQPPRRGNQHVGSTVDNPALIDKGNTADQQGHVQFVILAIDLEIFRDLCGKLPGWFQDQRTGHARPGPALGQDIDHR